MGPDNKSTYKEQTYLGLKGGPQDGDSDPPRVLYLAGDQEDSEARLLQALELTPAILDSWTKDPSIQYFLILPTSSIALYAINSFLEGKTPFSLKGPLDYQEILRNHPRLRDAIEQRNLRASLMFGES